MPTPPLATAVRGELFRGYPKSPNTPSIRNIYLIDDIKGSLYSLRYIPSLRGVELTLNPKP